MLHLIFPILLNPVNPCEYFKEIEVNNNYIIFITVGGSNEFIKKNHIKENTYE